MNKQHPDDRQEYLPDTSRFQAVYGPPPGAGEARRAALIEQQNIQMVYGPPSMGPAGFMSLSDQMAALMGTPWRCACGNANFGNFCTECGKKKPDA